MEFAGEHYKFTVPDHPTVRQQLEYFSAGAGLPMTLRHWAGAKVLIQNWESDKLPDYKTDLDTITDPLVTTLIIKAGIEVMQFVNDLEKVPKNS